MLTGSCLCRRIRFRLQNGCSRIHRCHCSLCRKRTGAGANATAQVRADQFEWLAGEDLIKRFRAPEGHGSHFCGNCGSPVPSFDRKQAKHWIPIGLLDAEPGVTVWGHFCVASKAEWDEITDDVEQFEHLPDY
jgi:hypothetical protein